MAAWTASPSPTSHRHRPYARWRIAIPVFCIQIGDGSMSKTLIDLDEELLAQAAELLSTKTKKDTVNQALSEYVRFRLRMRSGITAVAERHDISVLHDDRDFDVIAEITGQLVEWVVPPGTAD